MPDEYCTFNRRNQFSFNFARDDLQGPAGRADWNDRMTESYKHISALSLRQVKLLKPCLFVTKRDNPDAPGIHIRSPPPPAVLISQRSACELKFANVIHRSSRRSPSRRL